MLLKRTIAALGTLPLALAAQYNAETLLDSSFDDLAEQLLEELHVPGLSIAIIHNDKIKAKGYGFSQLPSTPATADTLWFTGSTTKAFTAAAMGKIVHGQTNITGLRWSTPLSEILGEDFVLRDEFANAHLSIEDAMSHRSGLPRHDAAYGWGNCSTTDVLRTMRNLPFSAQPRTRWQYNNMMFAAIGEAIQRLTGKSLETVLRTWLWEPLGMRSTFFNIDHADARKDTHGRNRLARGYFWQGSHYVPDRWIDILPVAGAGATISSVNDYALWARTLLDAGFAFRNRSSPIDSPLYIDLTTPRSIVTDLGLGAATPTYSLGWIIGVVAGKTIVTHSGGLAGFGTQLYLVPELNLGFVGVGNTAGTSAIAASGLFVEILHRLGVLDAATKEQHVAELEQLSSHTNPTSRSAKTESVARQGTDANNLPLPGRIADYTGSYIHPAYGAFNISVSSGSSSHLSSHQLSQNQQVPLLTSNPSLIITPSARTWSSIYTLTHTTHTFFNLTIYGVHGPAPNGDASCKGGKAKGRKLECKNEEVLERFGDGTAVFERGVEGQVERVGVELEEELVRWAEQSGKRGNWREGMIWLEREG